MKYLQCLVLISVIWSINSVSFGQEGPEQAIQPVVTTIENCTAPATTEQSTKQVKPTGNPSKTKVQTIVYCPQAKPAEKTKANEEEKEPTDQKLVVGELEKITLTPPGITYDARIDTGLSTSVLHAIDITPFERDGKKWVKFKVKDPESGEITEISRQVVKKVKAKQPDSDGQKAYIVKMNVRLGAIEQRISFSLTDRSNYDISVLIGRNFLKDMAIVDVSKQFTQKTPTPEQTPNLAVDEQQ
ncbi:ATP-dependent zinc protease family protein [Spartinivicinus poritis]|uniref:RimK/LysX family protein n=1 Tax=Spartinivicinus poritis TaxID=2994640 RepID=A0ABT5U6L0_9GAMM|nr:RimK/LysX family protein [Spartinivicinus sp. A2-2]MDE1461994.1 RimK/LysX family protein [Spartinivicinus sp. A2-2]